MGDGCCMVDTDADCEMGMVKLITLIIIMSLLIMPRIMNDVEWCTHDAAADYDDANDADDGCMLMMR